MVDPRGSRAELKRRRRAGYALDRRAGSDSHPRLRLSALHARPATLQPSQRRRSAEPPTVGRGLAGRGSVAGAAAALARAGSTWFRDTNSGPRPARRPALSIRRRRHSATGPSSLRPSSAIACRFASVTPIATRTTASWTGSSASTRCTSCCSDDAGKSWLTGDGPGRVPNNRIPSLDEWKADLGVGADAGWVGIYLRQGDNRRRAGPVLHPPRAAVLIVSGEW